MKSLIALALCFAGLLGVPWTGSAQKASNLNKLMLEKLDNSKMLLEGIALGDFNKIRRSADTLIQLSKTEEWFVFKTPRYELHSNEFRRAAENIVQKARDKSLDGATLAYFELTMSCVRCHQYVREVRDARLPVPLERGLASAGSR